MSALGADMCVEVYLHYDLNLLRTYHFNVIAFSVYRSVFVYDFTARCK